MTEQDFVPESFSENPEDGKVSWESPSNIALIKYWGKKDYQIPSNPSLSFTLKNCKTTTSVDFQKKQKRSEKFSFEVFFEGEKKEDFRPKIQKFLERTERYLPFLKEYDLIIRTSNSFPHSSGIASSASGMSALALCLMSIEQKINPGLSEEYFLKKASFLARLGSGSACRSVEGEIVIWGESEKVENSTNFFGIKYPYKVDEIFKKYQDIILLVDKGEKQVSSSLGHNLMEGHPFAAQRFRQADENLEKMREIFRSGDLEKFIKLVESEALTLHAMMMTSQPNFILMKPGTLSIINKIREFRQRSGLHPCFTLDAGANVHLLFPEKEKKEILTFVQDELSQFCEKNGEFICDEAGKGATKITE